MTNKKGDKRKQKGDKADTVTNKKGWKANTLSRRRTLLESLENP